MWPCRIVEEAIEDGHNNDEFNEIQDEWCGVVIISVHDEW